ncbi:MAG: hypothetical protein HY886_08150 [Deltaproteobacteria bacterium]|nr:hypothetical protein [Deltaproteobacteria bacterium]
MKLANGWTRIVPTFTASILALLFYSSAAIGASANIVAAPNSDGTVVVTATGYFASCTDSNGVTTNSGSISATLDNTVFLCSARGSDSATCTTARDKAGLHGTHTFTAVASDCQGTNTNSQSLTLDNTPVINITGPADGAIIKGNTVMLSGSFTFQPVMSPPYGSWGVYVDGGAVTTANCRGSIRLGF